jgi:hypothetical protein
MSDAKIVEEEVSYECMACDAPIEKGGDCGKHPGGMIRMRVKRKVILSSTIESILLDFELAK